MDRLNYEPAEVPEPVSAPQPVKAPEAAAGGSDAYEPDMPTDDQDDDLEDRKSPVQSKKENESSSAEPMETDEAQRKSGDDAKDPSRQFEEYERERERKQELTEEEEWEQMNARLVEKEKERLEKEKLQAEEDAKRLEELSKDPVKFQRLKRKQEKKQRWSNFYQSVAITNEEDEMKIQTKKDEALEKAQYEPEIDESKITLSWYDSDLNQYLELPELMSVVPLCEGAFSYAWSGSRASHGVRAGKVCYEVRVGAAVTTAEDNVASGLRIGWSTDDSTLHLGDGDLSWGFENTGRVVTNGEFKDYGKKLEEKDVIGVYLDLESSPCTISYTVNGVEQGVAFEIDRAQLGDKALFPHILTRNCCYKVNFGNDKYNMLTKTKIVRKRLEIPVEKVLEEKQQREEEFNRLKAEIARKEKERKDKEKRDREEKQRKKREEREKERKEREAAKQGNGVKEKDEDKDKDEEKNAGEGGNAEEKEMNGEKPSDEAKAEVKPEPMETDQEKPAEAKEDGAEAAKADGEKPKEEEAPKETEPEGPVPEVTEDQVYAGLVLDKRIKFIIRYTVDEELDGEAGVMLPGYVFICDAQMVAGPRRPAAASDCEVEIDQGVPKSSSVIDSPHRQPGSILQKILQTSSEMNDTSESVVELRRTHRPVFVGVCVVKQEANEDEYEASEGDVPMSPDLSKVKLESDEPTRKYDSCAVKKEIDIAPVVTVDMGRGRPRGARDRSAIQSASTSNHTIPDTPFDQVYVDEIRASCSPGTSQKVRVKSERQSPKQQCCNSDEASGDDSDYEEFKESTLLGEGAEKFEWYPIETFKGVKETFLPKYTGPVTPRMSIYDAFRSYWDDDILERIVTETNKYATTIQSELFQSEWYPTNSHEILILFAFWIMMGVIKMPTLKSCFSTDPLLKTECFRRMFTYKRYSKICQALRFNSDDPQSANPSKLHALSPIIDHLNSKFRSSYVPSQNVWLDESLTPWNGKLAFKQCSSGNPAKSGIKTFELCESSTGYLWSFLVYTGKETTAGDDPSVSKSASLAASLVHPLLGKGYTVYMKSWFNSPVLARYLKRNKTDCAGTLLASRRHAPPSITSAQLQRGQLIGAHSGDVAICAWQDSKMVLTISTFHGAETGLVNQGKGDVTKPRVVIDYNRNTSGVDRKDQMLEAYEVERKRQSRWYIKLFKRLLNCSVLNSRILVEASARVKSDHLTCRCDLVNLILDRHISLVPLVRTRQRLRCSLAPRGTSEAFEHWPVRVSEVRLTSRPTHHVRKRCVYCFFTKGVRNRKSMYKCHKCDVALCLDCFKDYHVNPTNA